MSNSAPSLILASGSPRRKDLMEEAGYSFTVCKPDVIEEEDPSIPIRELTALNAKLKGEAVFAENPDAVIVAADTLVLLGEKVFGKPETREEATNMLSELNGNTHQVLTAVAILSAELQHEFAVATHVHFKTLSVEERDDYHALIEPMDKAGAYAAQDHGERIIGSIEGSMTNVIGLPMDELAEVLSARFGIATS